MGLLKYSILVGAKAPAIVGVALCVSLFNALYCHAQSAKWAVKPTYEYMIHYGEQTYKIRSANKFGIVNSNGGEVVPLNYDSITDFRNGYALALTNKNGRFKIESIICEATMSSVNVSGVYYVTKYAAFSDDKLCVRSAKGDEGYIGTSGKLVIDCKYAEVHPFAEGLASVKLKNQKVVYIYDNGSPLIGIEPGEGIIYFGTTFRGGEAVVYARGATSMKGYVINKSGNTLRDYDVDISNVVVDDDNYTIYDKSLKNNVVPQKLIFDGPETFVGSTGKYGFKTGSTIVLPPQFSWAESFSGGFAIVCQNSRYGLLKLLRGSVSGHINGDAELKVINGKAEPFKYVVQLPEEWQVGKMELSFIDNNGHQKEYAASLATSIQREFPLSLTILGKPSSADYNISLVSDGLNLWNGSQKLTFSYGPSFSVSRISPSSIKAGPDDRCNGPSVTIRNNTNIAQSVHVRIYGGPVKEVSTTVEIAGNSSRTVSTYAPGITQTVTHRVYVEAGSFRLSKDITFVPFY